MTDWSRSWPLVSRWTALVRTGWHSTRPTTRSLVSVWPKDTISWPTSVWEDAKNWKKRFISRLRDNTILNTSVRSGESLRKSAATAVPHSANWCHTWTRTSVKYVIYRLIDSMSFLKTRPKKSRLRTTRLRIWQTSRPNRCPLNLWTQANKTIAKKWRKSWIWLIATRLLVSHVPDIAKGYDYQREGGHDLFLTWPTGGVWSDFPLGHTLTCLSGYGQGGVNLRGVRWGLWLIFARFRIQGGVNDWGSLVCPPLPLAMSGDTHCTDHMTRTNHFLDRLVHSDKAQ